MSQVKVLKIDPFYFSIFLFQFYNHFIKIGNYYRIFLYFFFLNKLLKKKQMKVFSLITYIIKSYYFSIESRSKFLSKRKKIAKKFKRKRKRQKRKGFFKKLFYLKVLNFPRKKLFKTIKKFYYYFIIKKDKNFLSQIYSSYISFFLNHLEDNIINKQFISEKYYASLNWNTKKFAYYKKRSFAVRSFNRKRFNYLKCKQIFKVYKLAFLRRKFLIKPFTFNKKQLFISNLSSTKKSNKVIIKSLKKKIWQEKVFLKTSESNSSNISFLLVCA